VIQLYLTRRNLLTLLNKLDRNKEWNGSSACCIIKRDTLHPRFPGGAVVSVTALEDEEYYTDREPGRVHSEDVPK
jgi:hypothetical protein